MGALLSLGSSHTSSSECTYTYHKNCKSQRVSSSFENTRLIPSLPDEISIQILARLPRICYFNLRQVSQKWNAILTSREIFELREELEITEQWLYLLTKSEDDQLVWHALDPLASAWQRLPPMPCVEHENTSGFRVRVIKKIRGWLRRKDEIDQMSFCGCAAGGIDGSLYVVGGFSHGSVMNRVWRFDPWSNKWNEDTPMSQSRAYCKTAVLDNKLYVVGGVSRMRGQLVPLQSAEVFDPWNSMWSDLPNMKSKAPDILVPLVTDMLKPMATGMTSYRGRLCVPQSLYSFPWFVDSGGEIYDPEMKSWGEMPHGMAEGWPARHAGNKLSMVVDGEMYAFDPCNGQIKVYDEKDDAWKIVCSWVPVCGVELSSDSPFLLSGLYGRLQFILQERDRVVNVMQADICSWGDVNGWPGFGSCFSEGTDLAAECETVVWRSIASIELGSSELLCCHVLDI